MSKLDLYPNLKSPPSAAQVATGTAFAVDKFGLDVNVLNAISAAISGAVTISGLKIALRNTTLNVTDVATALPAAPLALRNAFSIRNLDPLESIYVGNSDVTADAVIGTTSGWVVGPNEAYQVDITPDIILYARAETGKTVKVQVQELS